MKILFDINHPADVHQFKHVIKKLKKKHSVIVVARNKECVYELLEQNRIDYLPRKGYNNFIGKAIGFLFIDLKLFNIAKKFKPDVLVGSSGNLYVTHVGKLIGKPAIVFEDTEHSKLQNLLCFPFATKIITPDSFNLNIGKKHIKYTGSKEMAYLSRKYFKPNKKVLSELGIKKGQKIIFIRLVSWEASHDIGKKGIKELDEFIDFFERFGKVFISSEKTLPDYLRKYKLPKCFPYIHDLLFYADLVISEGATVAVEAAVLGTPTIYVNDLRMGYTDKLVKNGRIVQTTDSMTIINTAKKLISKKARKNQLDSKTDLNDYMVEKIVQIGK